MRDLEVEYLLELIEFGGGDLDVLDTGRDVEGIDIRQFYCVGLLSFSICRFIVTSETILPEGVGLSLCFLCLPFFLESTPAELLFKP